MAARHRVYLEAGTRRTFAVALSWPGWCRSGRDEQAALRALVAYGPRYAAAVKGVTPYEAPDGPGALEVVERLSGDASTDFGAPGAIPGFEGDATMERGETDRLLRLLRACWAAFDAAAAAHAGATLRTGPRGGGRDVARMVEHVAGAEGSYLHRLGGGAEAPGGDVASDLARVRSAALNLAARRARGETVKMGRRRAPLWPVRHYVRRSAWHALDHAWEIEDRAEAG